MILKSKEKLILIFIILGFMQKTFAQNDQITSKNLKKTFENVIKEYEILDTTGVVIITQISNGDIDLNEFRFSRLESQRMLLKNKPTSYFFVNKKLILYYGYLGLKENIPFDSTINDQNLFKLLVANSNKKLFDDLPKSKYLITSTYDPTEWIIKVNKKAIGFHDKEATQRIKTGNPRWKI